jgi:DNA invertase Pin-like site-specific DNA recombinase
VKIEYAYVSIEKGNLGPQRDALEGASVARAFEDHATGGRATSLNPSKIEHARMLIDGSASVSDTARTLNVDRSTLYRALRVAGAPA